MEIGVQAAIKRSAAQRNPDGPKASKSRKVRALECKPRCHHVFQSTYMQLQAVLEPHVGSEQAESFAYADRLVTGDSVDTATAVTAAGIFPMFDTASTAVQHARLLEVAPRVCQ